MFDPSNIQSGQIRKPWRAVLYGVEGVGKTTFAASCPKPIFIDLEGGSEGLDVRRFPKPSNWEDVNACFAWLYNNAETADVETLVIDSATIAQKMCIEHTCAANGWSSVEDAGYGKGFTMSAENFRKFIGALDAIHQKGINVLVIGHASIQTFSDPAGDNYDHYTMSLDKRIAPQLKEWCDVLLFANHDKSTKEVGEGFNKRVVAKSWGERVMFAEHRATWDAKNRYGLADQLPFSFDALQAGIDAWYAADEQKKAVNQ